MADADPGNWKEIARHDVVMATIREWTDRAGAVHVAVLLDRGPDREAPLLECEPGQPLTISRGEENFIVPPQALEAWARAQKLGGVGFYPESGFVHMDTGPIRTWSGE